MPTRQDGMPAKCLNKLPKSLRKSTKTDIHEI